MKRLPILLLIVGFLAADVNKSSPESVNAALVASSATVISTAATTAVKATAGTLRRIVLTTPVSGETVKLFDLASASCTGTPSTNPRAVITLTADLKPFNLEFQQSFANGICALTSSTSNLTVIFD